MKTLEQLSKHHKGGGGGSAAPAQSTIVSSPPPPTQQSVEVQMAQRDAAKQAAKKRGMNQTILAGETGGRQGYTAPTILGGAEGQKKTTLG